MKAGFLFILFISILCVSWEHTQRELFPKWLKGVWRTPYVSDTKRFQFWIFQNDSIFYQGGLMWWKNESLDLRYHHYIRRVSWGANSCTVTYSRPKQEIVYEFRLQTLFDDGKPHMSYSMTENGRITRGHCTSAECIFAQ